MSAGLTSAVSAVCTVYEVCAARLSNRRGPRRRELVRLAVVEKFEQRAPAADIAAERNDNILSIVFPQAARTL